MGSENQTAMTAPEVLEGKVDVFGAHGARHFDAALTAAHRFAQTTGCPPGGNVFMWLNTKSEELVAKEAALRQAARQSRGGEG